VVVIGEEPSIVDVPGTDRRAARDEGTLGERPGAASILAQPGTALPAETA